MSDEGIFLEVEEDEEGEEITLKKILISLFLFVLGLLVEHVAFIKGMLTATPILTSFDLHKAIYLALYFVAFIISGKEVIKSAIKNIFKGEIFDEKFLMALASIGAIFIGQLGEAVGIMLFYNIGEFFQDYATFTRKEEGKKRSLISSLLLNWIDKLYLLKRIRSSTIIVNKIITSFIVKNNHRKIISIKPHSVIDYKIYNITGNILSDNSVIPTLKAR